MSIDFRPSSLGQIVGHQRTSEIVERFIRRRIERRRNSTAASRQAGTHHHELRLRYRSTSTRGTTSTRTVREYKIYNRYYVKTYFNRALPFIE